MSDPYGFVLSEGASILVVDDDPIQCEFSCVYLGPATVVTAASAEEGLAILATQRFDIALIDVDMPGMDGLTMVEHLRRDERLRSMPVMMITGREDMASIDRAYAVGATSFMPKPVNWRLLAHQIKFLLRAQRALDGGSDAAA
jgi:CheY-like chemotaxis protein